MRRPVIALVAALAVVAAGLAAAYAYYFTGLHTAPRPLALSSPASTPAGAGTAAPATELAGRWTVAQGSQAGYRVKEQFAGQTSPHEAVARTSSVSGGFTVQQGSSGPVARGISVTAQLAGLQSVDQVAGFNVGQRDRIVSRQLDVQQYPDAVFQAPSAAVPAAVATGRTVSLTVPGQLTIHGTTRSAQASVQVRVSGGQLQLVGSTPVTMTDFGVQPPQVPITVVDPQVTIEFQLVLARAS